MSRRQTHLVFAGMLVSTFLSSLDGTAVSTALPTIAGELGGIDQLPWVLTAYLLGSVAATPLYGKLSDLYGRRLLTEIALAVFIVTSITSGTVPASSGPSRAVTNEFFSTQRNDGSRGNPTSTGSPGFGVG